jgi:hypothetical protein
MTSVTTARTSLAVVCFFVCALTAAVATAGPVTLQVLSAGTTIPKAAAPGSGDQGNIERPFTFPGGEDEADAGGVEIDGVFNPRPFVNRTIGTGPGQAVPAAAARRAKSNPELRVSFDGLNAHDQTFANGRSNFEWEPPDQSLCVGNGFVIESVNSALRVDSTAGNLLTGAIDLNTFYGLPAAIQRHPGLPNTFGPEINDPSCYFDPDTQRWFHVALIFEVNPANAALTGVNRFDIAVSQTPNPLGPWTLYRVPVQNDGTQGTPDHGCIARVSGHNVHGPCFGDQPRLGADANAFFVTTNEFNFFAPGFRGTQVYAFSKRALAASTPTVTTVLFDTADPSVSPVIGFSIFAATSPAGIYETGDGGTEYFLSSDAVLSTTQTSDHVLLWAVSNTQAINSMPSALALSVRAVETLTYSRPTRSHQKAGNFPLRDCLADTLMQTPTGFGCWRLQGIGGGPFLNLPEALVDSDDSRMERVTFANGKLWGALTTAVLVNGETHAGIAYFVLNPHSGNIFQQGIIAVSGNNVIYPALAVTPSGRGVMTFTLVGPDHFPSAAYVGLDAKIGAGDLHIAADGVGPTDGFTEYGRVFGSRPRWGDYGAAAVDGNSIWIASEYIAQTCNLAQYEMTPFGQCGGTRTIGLNWATRISEINTLLEISVGGP